MHLWNQPYSTSFCVGISRYRYKWASFYVICIKFIILVNRRKKVFENQAILSGPKWEVCKGTFSEKWQNEQDVLQTAFLAVFYHSGPPTAQRLITSKNIYWCILSIMSQQSITPISMTWCAPSASTAHHLHGVNQGHLQKLQGGLLRPLLMPISAKFRNMLCW